jgi:hypothetical protein
LDIAEVASGLRTGTVPTFIPDPFLVRACTAPASAPASDLSEGVQGEIPPGVAQAAAPVVAVVVEPTPVPVRRPGYVASGTTMPGPPPDDIPIDDALIGYCAMAGAPVPTRDHVLKFLANARSKNLEFPNWIERFKLWMLEEKKRRDRERNYESRSPGSRVVSGGREPPPPKELRPPQPPSDPSTPEQVAERRRRWGITDPTSQTAALPPGRSLAASAGEGSTSGAPEVRSARPGANAAESISVAVGGAK